MILTLEDNYLGKKGKSKFGKVFGRVAGTMVGIPPVRKSDFQKKKGGSPTAPALQITPQMVKAFNKRRLKIKSRQGGKAFAGKKKGCKCISPGLQKKVIYNNRTKEAYIVPMNDNGMGNVLTTALTSNPYGAAIKGGFDIVKGVFGGKKKKASSGGGKAGAPGVPSQAEIDNKNYIDLIKKAQAKIKEINGVVESNKVVMGKFKTKYEEQAAKMKTLETEKASLEKQRIYFAGGGLVAGAVIGYALKR